MAQHDRAGEAHHSAGVNAARERGREKLVTEPSWLGQPRGSQEGGGALDRGSSGTTLMAIWTSSRVLVGREGRSIERVDIRTCSSLAESEDGCTFACSGCANANVH